MLDTADRSVINITRSLKRLGDDRRLMDDLINFYFEDSPALLEELRSAIQLHDWDRLLQAAHSFKGLVGNFDAAPAGQVLQQLELQGIQHNPDQLSQLMATAEIEVARLTTALTEYQRNCQAVESGG